MLQRLPWPLSQISLFWWLQVLGWSGFGLVSFYALSAYFEVSEPGTLILYEATRMAMALSMTLLVRPFYRRLWARPASFPAIGLACLAGSLACGVGLLVSFKLIFMRAINPLSRAGDLSTYPKTILDYSLIFFAWSVLYFGIKYWRELEAERQRRLRTQALARQAQLQMLRYQLNPHFLFNSLNSIHALIREEPDRAEEVVEELSDFLRSSLLSGTLSEVPLRDEIAVIHSYLTIEQLRFEDKLEVEFRVDPEAESFLLPSFLVHPLVENAIKHGMKTSAKPLRLRLEASLEHQGLRVRVSNSGALIETNGSETTGIGLANIRERLEVAYPERHSFEISEHEGWVHATISIEASERSP